MNEKGQELPERMEKKVMREKKDTNGKQMQKHLLSQSGATVDIRQVLYFTHCPFIGLSRIIQSFPPPSLNQNQGVLKKKALTSQ